MAESLKAEGKHNEAQEYLRQVELCDAHINSSIEELDRLNALALKITTSLSLAPAHGGGSHDKVGDAASRIADLKTQINVEIDHYCDLKAEVKAVICKVTDVAQLNVLMNHYILYKTLEQIACEMGYSYRNICYIHGRALQAVAEILKGE